MRKTVTELLIAHPMGYNIGEVFLLCWHVGIVISWPFILPVGLQDSLAQHPQVVHQPRLAHQQLLPGGHLVIHAVQQQQGAAS